MCFFFREWSAEEDFVFCCLLDLGLRDLGLDDLETRAPGDCVDLLGRDVPLVEVLEGTLARTVRVGAMAG